MVACLSQVLLATSIVPQLILLPSISSAFLPLPKTRAKFAAAKQRPIMMSSTSTSTNNEDKLAHIDKLALILINSKRQQLVARSYGKSVYYTPGGKREPGETDIEALLRECKEELDTNLLTSTNTSASIEPYGTFEAQAFGKPEGTMVKMTCFRVTPVDAEFQIAEMVKPNEEIEELLWITSDFDRAKLTVTGIMILEDLKAKDLID